MERGAWSRGPSMEALDGENQTARRKKGVHSNQQLKKPPNEVQGLKIANPPNLARPGCIEADKKVVEIK